MKIEIKEQDNCYKLIDLPVGETFSVKGKENPLIRTDRVILTDHLRSSVSDFLDIDSIREIGCVDLATGVLEYMSCDTWVTKEDLKVIKDEEK